MSPTAPFLSIAKERGERTPAKTTFLHFLSALRNVKTRFSLPHVRGKFPVSFRQRTASATAPLPLMPTPNNAFGSTVATVSGSGAGGQSVRHTARHGICSVNAWYMVSNGNKNSAQGSEETFGFFRLFCPLFQLLGKVGRRRPSSRRSAKPPCRRRQKRENPSRAFN